MFNKPGPILVILGIAEFVVFLILNNFFSAGSLIFLTFLLSSLGVFGIIRTAPSAIKTNFKSFFSDTQDPNSTSDANISLLASFFLAFPGFLSASLGLSLFVPPIRGYAGRWLNKKFSKQKLFKKSGRTNIFSQFMYKDVVDVDISNRTQKDNSANPELRNP